MIDSTVSYTYYAPSLPLVAHNIMLSLVMSTRQKFVVTVAVHLQYMMDIVNEHSCVDPVRESTGSHVIKSIISSLLTFLMHI